MARKRNHNEWFRPVYTKAVWATVNQECFLHCVGCWGLHPCDLCGGTGFRKREVLQGHVSRRKSCPTCGSKLAENEFVWSWGEYAGSPRWTTIKHFCRECFEVEVRQVLLAHQDGCGCDISLVGRGCNLPEWLTLGDEPCDELSLRVATVLS